MGIFSAIIAVIKAIPVVDAWFQALITFYVNTQIDRMAAENRAAIKKAIDEKDTRDLEKVIGSPDAGEPSHLPGAVVIDHPPGLPK
jgi:hypothetical protein